MYLHNILQEAINEMKDFITEEKITMQINNAIIIEQTRCYSFAKIIASK